MKGCEAFFWIIVLIALLNILWGGLTTAQKNALQLEESLQGPIPRTERYMPNLTHKFDWSGGRPDHVVIGATPPNWMPGTDPAGWSEQR